MSDINRSSAKYAAVTKSDTTDLRLVSGDSDSDPRALYVGGAGNVVVQGDDLSTSVTFAGVPAGTTLMIRPRRVMDATTATNIVALY